MARGEYMRAELQGLNGGSKQFWLQTHRKEVEQYYFQHGPDATLVEFNMRQATLERFLARKGNDDRINRLSEADRWVLRVTNEGIRETKRRVSELESWRVEVEPVIAMGKALIDITKVQIKAKVESLALPQDSLRLTNFGGKSGK
jgi:hypothetical protein